MLNGLRNEIQGTATGARSDHRRLHGQPLGLQALQELALVVLVGGELAWFVERGGRSVLTFTTDPGAHHAAAVALAIPFIASRNRRNYFFVARFGSGVADVLH